MDLHVLFCFFFVFVFAFVLITFTLGLPLCIKIVALFSFVFTCFVFFLCKLQSINFIDISKFIPELSLQRTFLVSKKLSFFYFTFRTKLFFFFISYISHKIVFCFLILYCLAATRRRFLFYFVFFALHFYLFYFGVFYYLLSGNKLNIFLCIKTFSMPFPFFFFLFLCSALLLHFVAFFASTTSLQFSVFFRCSQRAMQETQPTRSKAKFQLNQRTVQTDREPNKPNERTERMNEHERSERRRRRRQRERRTRNNKLKLKFKTHTHTRTHWRKCCRQSQHSHTHTHIQTCWRTRFVLLLVGGLVAAAVDATSQLQTTLRSTQAALLTAKLHVVLLPLICC